MAKTTHQHNFNNLLTIFSATSPMQCMVIFISPMGPTLKFSASLIHITRRPVSSGVHYKVEPPLTTPDTLKTIERILVMPRGGVNKHI
jgi:hypothetical protein